jgi:hypothetical protein
MAFSQASITSGPTFAARGPVLVVSWASSAPAGTAFQLYADKRLIWSGTQRSVSLPYPTGRTTYTVGTVAAGEGQTNFAASLPATPGGGDRARLSWYGGTFLDPDGNDGVQAFRVYGGLVPGGAVDYDNLLATVPAYTIEPTDGFGRGAFGQGGFGRSAGEYSWTSDPLSGGTWNFAVRAVDKVGNETTLASSSVILTAPPMPPAADALGRRLTYSYNAGTQIATLSWLASPG